MDRLLTLQLLDHLGTERQMVFLTGPRQVGKTTIARTLCDSLSTDEQPGLYLNWDNQQHRGHILEGPQSVASLGGADRLSTEQPLVALDELHKYSKWRDFLKGLFDTYENRLRIVVTGSARLGAFKRGGDSLMGRYFPFTLHPLSVGELAGSSTMAALTQNPVPICDDQWHTLQKFGGFPEPFLRDEQRFYNRWHRLRTEQLLGEDIRDLTRVQEIGQLEHLAVVLTGQVGQLCSYTSLSRAVRVSVDTIRRWTTLLEALYWCFSIRPWHSNVARSLRKEPKYYLWDWSSVTDAGARAENMVASALYKTVQGLQQDGHGDFSLHFLRDKQKREVDFIVVRDGKPWFLVEVKSSGKAALSPQLDYYQKQTGALHAFQLAMDLPYVDRDCFSVSSPVIVPARTLLSQLR